MCAPPAPPPPCAAASALRRRHLTHRARLSMMKRSRRKCQHCNCLIGFHLVLPPTFCFSQWQTECSHLTHHQNMRHPITPNPTIPKTQKQGTIWHWHPALRNAAIVSRERIARDSASRCSSYIVSKKDAPWQRMLDMNDKGGNSIHDEKSNDGKYFRRRFRMPYALFKVLIREILRDKWFQGFGPNGEGRMGAIKLETHRGASLQVMVLSVFRILGRGTAFDECYDGSGCREESIRVFFHNFCPKFVEKLMPSIVRPPVTNEEIREQVNIYQRLGMGGAVGSTDCTHFALGKCSDKISILCYSAREKKDFRHLHTQ